MSIFLMGLVVAPFLFLIGYGFAVVLAPICLSQVIDEDTGVVGKIVFAIMGLQCLAIGVMFVIQPVIVHGMPALLGELVAAVALVAWSRREDKKKVSRRLAVQVTVHSPFTP
jgi:hypothetical protein